MIKGARSSAVVALLVICAGLAIAACGSSNSSSSSASASAAGTTTSASGTSTTGHGGFAGITATQRSCLKSKGVTLPTGGGFRHGTGTGTFTGPTGAPPAGGTSTTGGPGGGPGGGGFGGGGFFGRGGAGGGNSKFATAAKACGITFGGAGRFRGGAGAAGAKVSSTALKAFVSCVDKHGYTLTGVNTSGTGAALPASLRTNQKFLAAAKDCTQDLRPTGTPGGSGTSTPSGT